MRPARHRYGFRRRLVSLVLGSLNDIEARPDGSHLGSVYPWVAAPWMAGEPNPVLKRRRYPLRPSALAYRLELARGRDDHTGLEWPRPSDVGRGWPASC
jgi:hypothetical protein